MQDDHIILIRKTLEGNGSAFNTLVKMTSPRVFSIIYKFFYDRIRVEDIAQEVYLSAYTKLHTYGQEKPFENWLSSITVRHCYKALQETKSNRQISESDLNYDTASVMDNLLFENIWQNPMEQDVKLCLQDIVSKILDTLSPREKTVLILTEVEGMSLKEAADMMGISQIYAKVTHFRARKNALKAFKSITGDRELCI